MQFKLKDVVTVAKALLEDPIEYMDGDFIPYYWCLHCDAILKGYDKNIKDFIHDIDCPCLVAQDLLTRIE